MATSVDGGRSLTRSTLPADLTKLQSPGGAPTQAYTVTPTEPASLDHITREVGEQPARARIAEATDLAVLVARVGPAGGGIREIYAPKGKPLPSQEPDARGGHAHDPTARRTT